VTTANNAHILRYGARETDITDGRAVVIDVEVPDDGPAALKEGLARRAIVNAGGICPCGARMILPNRAARRRATRLGKAIVVTILHEDDCPALLPGYAAFDLGPEGAAS
jgi:hypothetical protein